MSELGGTHWIGGSRRAGTDGYRLRQRIDPFEPMDTWPRAGAELVAEALNAARAGREAWLGLSRVERDACLRRALDHLRADGSWSEHLGRMLGILPVEVESELFALDALAEGRGPTGFQARAGADAAAGVVFSSWTDLVSGIVRRIAAQLDFDRGVVVLSDARWPAGAHAVGAALSAAGFPEGLVSILHGVEAPVRDEILFAAPTGGATAAGFGDAAVPFVLDLGGVERGNRSFLVLRDTNLESAALEVLEQSFGRAATFSGQRPGRVGRVLCNLHVFSAFCERLVEAIERSSEMANPVPIIDNESLANVRALWNLGLDEGATLIFGGENLTSASGQRLRDPRVLPTVFTNVEPAMEIGRLREPVPILSLLRTLSDDHARELEREFD